jgi:hypothetical protein
MAKVAYQTDPTAAHCGAAVQRGVSPQTVSVVLAENSAGQAVVDLLHTLLM